MSNSRYIKDVRVKTGEFYIVKRISEDKFEIIFTKGNWFWTGTNFKILDEGWIFNDNDGLYKAKYISKQEAFMEIL